MSIVATINFQTKKSIERWEIMRSLMSDEPMTGPEMARIVGINPERANAFLLHYRHMVHIHHWKQCGCTWTAVWALGNAEDAVKPKGKQVKAKRVERLERMAKTYGFVKQPVSRDWSVALMFGPGVNLNDELRGMHA